jgi:hypothetical protein
MTTLEKKFGAETSLLFKVSVVTASAMVLVFATMKLLGLVYIVELRAINFLIMFMGVRYILLRNRFENGHTLEYLSGMLTGFFTAVLTSVLFAGFLATYLKIDSGFMNFLHATQPMGQFLTPSSTALIIVFEGSSSGAILSFALMHLFNRDTVQG